jgi:hypothetical protein
MKLPQRYYYVEPFKEQEISLLFKSDSTFSFQDASGCNQFEFTGKYKKVAEGESNYFVFDSVKLQNVLPNSKRDAIFHMENANTAWIINKKRVFIHKQPFIATSNININLQEIRYRKLEDYYTGLLGQKGFYKSIWKWQRKKGSKKALIRL